MADLNDIRVNLAELRMALAQLQKDKYEDIGITDLLVLIKAMNTKPIEITEVKPVAAVSPLRTKMKS